MATCKKCEGKMFLNGKTCNKCNGTGSRDGTIPPPTDGTERKVSTVQWTKAIRSQMASKKLR